MSGKINYNSGWLNPTEVYELRTELAEFKLLELSLGKRIENLVSDVDEHEAENKALLEALNKIVSKLSYYKNEHGISEYDIDIIIFDSINLIAEAIQGEK